MSGSGGHKHRRVRRRRKASQANLKARANLARVKNQFEKKGQSWDPANNGPQMAALNHGARRLMAHSPVQNH